MPQQIRVIAVGRHSSSLYNLPAHILVVGHESITWSHVQNDLFQQWDQLRERAKAAKAKILLQNMPAVLIPAIVRQTRNTPVNVQLNVGVVIMRQRRQRQLGTQLELPTGVRLSPEKWVNWGQYIVDAVNHVDNKAHIEFSDDGSMMRITAEPQTPPVDFDHIEWL